MKTLDDISPLDALKNTLHFWWLIAVLGIAGGMLGWLFTRLQPPLYEANTSLYVALRQQELVAEDQIPMSYTMQEQYLSPVLALFYNQDVEDQLVAEAEAHAIDFGHADFNSQDFRVERFYSRWQIVVRNQDPQAAAELANLWTDIFYAALAEANQQACEAGRLRAEATLLRSCIENSSFAAANTCAGTSFTDLSDMVAGLTSLEERSTSALEAARGITSALDFSITEYASIPTEPILFRQGITIFAGAAIGLLVGFILAIVLPLPGTRRHDQPEK